MTYINSSVTNPLSNPRKTFAWPIISELIISDKNNFFPIGEGGMAL
jgi:hypothetical protein